MYDILLPEFLVINTELKYSEPPVDYVHSSQLWS